uniref:Uncharacterized protein n=1 Tax=Cyprinodon variegatus TaxID=28743 RepID=A0A3Q2DGI6_CYPVA
MWTGRSKKPTMTGSLSSEAKTCSKENDQSTSGCRAAPSWLLGELEASEVSSSVKDASTEAVLPARGLLGSCSLRPTSSILRRRLVTWATARYNDSSSGSPWKIL